MAWHKHAKLLISFTIAGCGSSGEDTVGTPVPDRVLAGSGENEGVDATENEISSNQPKGEDISPEQIDAIFAEEAAARVKADAATELKAASQFYKFYDIGTTSVDETITNNGQHICIMDGFGGGTMVGRNGVMFVGMKEVSGNPIKVAKTYNPPAWTAKLYVRCVPRTWFTTNNGFLAFQHRSIGIERDGHCGTGIKDDYLFNGNWAAAVTGMGLSFNPGDEIWTVQTDSMTSFNQLKVKAYSGTDCWMTGFATGFAVRNDGRPAKFKGPGGTGLASIAGEYEYYGPTSAYLGVSPEYLCYFSSIKGRGGTPAALMQQVSPAGFYSITVAASAMVRVRCVAYDQT